MSFALSAMREFRYSAGLEAAFRKEMRFRRMFWCAFASPFVIMAIFYVGTESFWLAALIASVAIAILSVFELMLRRHTRETMELIGTRLRYDGSSLQQFDGNGEVIASIELSQQYNTSYGYHAAGNAIYKVEQKGRKVLRFSTRIEGAEEIVTEILGEKEWPPGANDV